MLHKLLAFLALSLPCSSQALDFSVQYGPHQPYMRVTGFIPPSPNGSLVVFNHAGGFLNREPLDFIGPIGPNDSLKRIRILLGALHDEGFTVVTLGLSGSNLEAYVPNPGMGTFRPFNDPEFNPSDTGSVFWYDECAAVAYNTARVLAEAGAGMQFSKVFFWGNSAGCMTSLPVQTPKEKYLVGGNCPLSWLALHQNTTHTNQYLPKEGTQEPIQNAISEASNVTQFQASPMRWVDEPAGIIWVFNFPLTPNDYALLNPGARDTLAEIHDSGPAYYAFLERDNDRDEFWLDDENWVPLKGVQEYVDPDINTLTGVRSEAAMVEVGRWIRARHLD